MNKQSVTYIAINCLFIGHLAVYVSVAIFISVRDGVLGKSMPSIFIPSNTVNSKTKSKNLQTKKNGQDHSFWAKRGSYASRQTYLSSSQASEDQGTIQSRYSQIVSNPC